MSATVEHWPHDLVLFLKGITRELTFDWNAIADSVRNHGTIVIGCTDVSFVTPKTCREAFAFDYSASAQAKGSVAEATDAKEKEDSDPSKVNGVMADMLRDYENMSLDELIEHVNTTEEHLKRRREHIFGRVLTSLAGDSSQEPLVSTMDYELTRQAFADNLAMREQERLKKLAYEEEVNEKLRLEHEREALKKRFDVGSADREGEDPLGFAETPQSAAKSGSKYGDKGGMKMGEKKSAELDYIDSLPYDPTVVQVDPSCTFQSRIHSLTISTILFA
jgi:hypothetical protein